MWEAPPVPLPSLLEHLRLVTTPLQSQPGQEVEDVGMREGGAYIFAVPGGQILCVHDGVRV